VRSVERGNSSPFPTLPVMDCVHKEYDRTRSFSRSGGEAKGYYLRRSWVQIL